MHFHSQISTNCLLQILLGPYEYAVKLLHFMSPRRIFPQSLYCRMTVDVGTFLTHKMPLPLPLPLHDKHEAHEESQRNYSPTT